MPISAISLRGRSPLPEMLFRLFELGKKDAHLSGMGKRNFLDAAVWIAGKTDDSVSVEKLLRVFEPQDAVQVRLLMQRQLQEQQDTASRNYADTKLKIETLEKLSKLLKAKTPQAKTYCSFKMDIEGIMRANSDISKLFTPDEICSLFIKDSQNQFGGYELNPMEIFLRENAEFFLKTLLVEHKKHKGSTMDVDCLKLAVLESYWLKTSLSPNSVIQALTENAEEISAFIERAKVLTGLKDGLPC